MGILITGIFSIVTLQKLMAGITLTIRHMDRPSDSDTTQNRTIAHNEIVRRHGLNSVISLIDRLQIQSHVWHL